MNKNNNLFYALKGTSIKFSLENRKFQNYSKFIYYLKCILSTDTKVILS